MCVRAHKRKQAGVLVAWPCGAGGSVTRGREVVSVYFVLYGLSFTCMWSNLPLSSDPVAVASSDLHMPLCAVNLGAFIICSLIARTAPAAVRCDEASYLASRARISDASRSRISDISDSDGSARRVG